MSVLRETTVQRFIGASTDTKPTSVPTGSIFWETDTKNTYKSYDGTNWILYSGGAGSGTAGLCGQCSATMAASTFLIQVPGLAGYGDDFFNDKFFLQIIKNNSVPGNIPERQVRQITDYASTTGTFTVNAFSSNVEASDWVMVLHETDAELAGPTASINKSVGKLQVAIATEDLKQLPGDKGLFIGTTQAVILEKLVIKMPNTTAVGSGITSITVQNDDTTATAYITIQLAAAMTAEQEFVWSGVSLINVGTKINLTLAGSATSSYIVTAIAQCRAVVGGGYLAESTGASMSPSASPSASPSKSPSASPSVSPSASPSLSPSASASPSASPSLSPSASVSPSISPSASPSVSPSASPSVSPSVSPSLSPSASASPSASPSTSPSVSPSASPSLSPSASASPSVSPSASPSVSPSASPSLSPSASASPSASPSLSPSASASPSESPSLSPSASTSPSASPSLSPSASTSPSKSPSASPSVSPSASPSESPSENPA